MRDNGTGFVLFHGRKCSINLVFELLLMAVPSLLSMLTDIYDCMACVLALAIRK
jgi:hypothetical protein